jgi:hypothetical protein
MIRYVLRCDNGHTFEAWLYSTADRSHPFSPREMCCPLCELRGYPTPDEAGQIDSTNRAAAASGNALRLARPTMH